MNRTGVTKALVDFAMSLVGRLRGGLGYVNVLTSIFFAGISGSAVADTAAIGSVLDLSGTFYNPGGLSLIEKPATIMATQIFHYPRLTLTGYGKNVVPQNAHNLGPAPSLVAGTIRVRGLENHWFGYSFLARQSVKLGASVSSTGVRDVLPGLAGAEDFEIEQELVSGAAGAE